MYENGEGVRQDSAEAAKWFRLAANQGHTGAQFYLGGMYASGNGVPRDYVQAYMWFDLSSAGEQDFYATASRSAVADKMTPAQIAEARRLAEAWKSKRPDRSYGRFVAVERVADRWRASTTTVASRRARRPDEHLRFRSMSILRGPQDVPPYGVSDEL